MPTMGTLTANTAPAIHIKVNEMKNYFLAIIQTKLAARTRSHQDF